MISKVSFDLNYTELLFQYPFLFKSFSPETFDRILIANEDNETIIQVVATLWKITYLLFRS